jgi:hypothetical protein
MTDKQTNNSISLPLLQLIRPRLQQILQLLPIPLRIQMLAAVPGKREILDIEAFLCEAADYARVEVGSVGDEEEKVMPRRRRRIEVAAFAPSGG